MSTEKTQETTVETVDVNVDTLFGNAVTSTAEPKKSVFSPVDADLSFLDFKKSSVEESTEESTEERTEEHTEKSDKVDPIESVFEEEEEDKSKGGRPSALVAATKQLIEEAVLSDFEGYEKDLKDYNQEDYVDLIKQNIDKIKEEYPVEFFNSLPEPFQKAYGYVLNGGRHLREIFEQLAYKEQIREIDTSTEEGQRYIVRTYLQGTKFGTPEEIEEEITSYEDRGILSKKAGQFQPQIQAEIDRVVQNEYSAQEDNMRKHQARYENYAKDLFDILEPGELNGIKLDNRTQNMLYAGLTQMNMTAPNGARTNLLGYLIDRAQWGDPRNDIKPNRGLMAEVLWLLQDPEGYKKKIAEGVTKEVNATTYRRLKSEQSTKSVNTSMPEDNSSTVIPKRSVQKPKNNFFTRN